MTNQESKAWICCGSVTAVGSACRRCGATTEIQQPVPTATGEARSLEEQEAQHNAGFLTWCKCNHPRRAHRNDGKCVHSGCSCEKHVYSAPTPSPARREEKGSKDELLESTADSDRAGNSSGDSSEQFVAQQEPALPPLSERAREAKAANDYSRAYHEQQEQLRTALFDKQAALARVEELESYKINADHAGNLGIIENGELRTQLQAIREQLAALLKYEFHAEQTVVIPGLFYRVEDVSKLRDLMKSEVG